MTLHDLQVRFGNINENEYTSFRQFIRENIASLRVNLSNIQASHPFQPPIIRCLRLSKSGCGAWNKLKEKIQITDSIKQKENKWEDILGRTQGIFFWDRCYRKTMSIYFDNKLKWFQYQTNRGSLKTNKILSKFIPEISQSCTFCGQEVETIKHLFWECRIVADFINSVMDNFTQNFDILRAEHNLKSFIFADFEKKPIYSPVNFATLYIRYYIWISRCRKSNLTQNNFLEWFSRELKILKNAYSNDKNLIFISELLNDI